MKYEGDLGKLKPMTEPVPTITEAEAQQLANWTVFTLKQTQDEGVCFLGLSIFLPIRIASDRPWTEQIWVPE